VLRAAGTTKVSLLSPAGSYTVGNATLMEGDGEHRFYRGFLSSLSSPWPGSLTNSSLVVRMWAGERKWDVVTRGLERMEAS